MRFLLLFLIFPAVELYVLVKVGARIGALNTVLWVFASAALGIWAVRAQGRSAMVKVRSELAEGRIPQNPFLESLLLFFAGVLLILPGFISDFVGLLLLLPPLRRLAAAGLVHYLTAQRTRAGQGGSASRVIFFSSGDLSGFGGVPRNGGTGMFPGGPHGSYGPDGPGGPGGPGGDVRRMHPGESEQGPREATIIESTAIVTEREEGGERNTPDTGASGRTKNGKDSPEAEG